MAGVSAAVREPVGLGCVWPTHACARASSHPNDDGSETRAAEVNDTRTCVRTLSTLRRRRRALCCRLLPPRPTQRFARWWSTCSADRFPPPLYNYYTITIHAPSSFYALLQNTRHIYTIWWLRRGGGVGGKITLSYRVVITEVWVPYRHSRPSCA